MDSLEALREMVTTTLKYLPNEVIDKIGNLSNIVLKDLERLEKLEKENKELQAKLDRSLPRVVIRNTLENVIPSLEEENEKLKQLVKKQLDLILKLDTLTYSMPTYYRDIVKDYIEHLLENIKEVIK